MAVKPATIETLIVDVPTIRPPVLAMATMHHHRIFKLKIGKRPMRDDVAYAAREELIPPVVRHADPSQGPAPFSEIEFDFTLAPAVNNTDEHPSARPRALVA